MNIKIEKRNKVKFFVVREKGKIITAKKVKGSGLTLRTALDRYKSRGTFSTEFTEKRMRIGRTIEVTRFYGEKIPPKINQMKKYMSFQYVIGTKDIGGRNGIWGRSDKISELEFKSKRAISQAEHRFYSLVDNYETGGYDEDDGRNAVEANKNVKIMRGYIWYVKPKGRPSKASNRRSSR